MAEHQQHAIFGGGPSYSVHPLGSGLRPLVALNATFEVHQFRKGNGAWAATEFFRPAQPETRRGEKRPSRPRSSSPAVPHPDARPRAVVSTYLKITDRGSLDPLPKSA